MLQINNSSFEATLLASSSSELVAIMFVGILITVVCVGARLTVFMCGCERGPHGGSAVFDKSYKYYNPYVFSTTSSSQSSLL